MVSRSTIQRGLPWSQALQAMRQDRLARPEIREERLRTSGTLRTLPAITLSAWRGRSGRRYVVAVHPGCKVDLVDADGAVVIAVRRDADTIARIVGLGVLVVDQDELAFWRMITRARDAGATELHLHRLAETPAEREAIIEDLTA